MITQTGYKTVTDRLTFLLFHPAAARQSVHPHINAEKDDNRNPKYQIHGRQSNLIPIKIQIAVHTVTDPLDHLCRKPGIRHLMKNTLHRMITDQRRTIRPGQKR